MLELLKFVKERGNDDKRNHKDIFDKFHCSQVRRGPKKDKNWDPVSSKIETQWGP